MSRGVLSGGKAKRITSPASQPATPPITIIIRMDSLLIVGHLALWRGTQYRAANFAINRASASRSVHPRPLRGTAGLGWNLGPLTCTLCRLLLSVLILFGFE
jgi:hypothetical protein